MFKGFAAGLTAVACLSVIFMWAPQSDPIELDTLNPFGSVQVSVEGRAIRGAEESFDLVPGVVLGIYFNQLVSVYGMHRWSCIVHIAGENQEREKFESRALSHRSEGAEAHDLSTTTLSAPLLKILLPLPRRHPAMPSAVPGLDS